MAVSAGNVTSIINAAATVILVLVTAAYAYLTWRLVKETQQAREQEVRPVINLDVEPFSITAWGPKIENVGNGPALDVSGKVQLKPGGGASELRAKSIPAGDFTGMSEPLVDADSHSEYDVLEITGEVTDAFGNRQRFHDTYDPKLLAENDGAESMMKRDWRERNLRDIEKHLRSIAENIEMDGLQKLVKIRSRERVLTQLQEHSPITVEELSEQTGLTRHELGEDLIWLSEAGAIEYDVAQNEIFDEENLDVEIRLQNTGEDATQ